MVVIRCNKIKIDPVINLFGKHRDRESGSTRVMTLKNQSCEFSDELTRVARNPGKIPEFFLRDYNRGNYCKASSNSDDSTMGEVYAADYSVRKIVGRIIGVSPSIVRLRRAARKLAKVDETVLITGEPGTGKRLLARTIHQLSARREAPFIEVHSGHLCLQHNGFSNGSSESVLIDLLEKSADGVLYISRIEELAPEIQIELLAYLGGENGYSKRAPGMSRRPHLILSCETEPDEAISSKKLRSDFFYAASKIMLNVPPLRYRKQDIPHLVEHFIRQAGTRLETDIDFQGISDEVYDALMAYEWRGNVAELENSITTLVATSEQGKVVPEILPFLQETEPLRPLQGKSLPEAIAMVEDYLLRKALGRFEGNQTRAAQFLKISEASLRYKLKKYNILNK